MVKSKADQLQTEAACAGLYGKQRHLDGTLQRERIVLHRDAHVAYLLSGLGQLSGAYSSLDASRPWLCYWIVHSLELIAPGSVPAELADQVAGFLSRCQDGAGGFCGGPAQAPHLAPTYAAVCALATLGTERAYACLDRARLRSFLLRMKTAEGGFRMHEDGECDVRGSYTALAVASLANVLDAELAAGAAEWIASCQTHEGGIGATPGEEAHGGYTFCGLAGLVLLGAVDRLRVPQLAHWLAQRQMGAEGGFQGRTNKLVDGCYSFWQGGSFPLLHAAIQQRHRSGGEGRGDDAAAAGAPPFFNARALLDYVMVCCQVPHGGLRDKPGRSRDYYHTCYCLSGLAIGIAALAPGGGGGGEVPDEWLSSAAPVNPVYNISAEKAEAMLSHFAAFAVPRPASCADSAPYMRNS